MITDVRLSTRLGEIAPHAPPPQTASAEPATLTSAAAYEGGVMKNSTPIGALTCPDGGVRFGAYTSAVMKKTFHRPALVPTAAAKG